MVQSFDRYGYQTLSPTWHRAIYVGLCRKMVGQIYSHCHKSLAEMQPSVKGVDTDNNMYVESTLVSNRNFDVATTTSIKR